jgi:hypothetical protein
VAKKKTVNWAAIKKRWLTGESAKSIADDYGITARAITDKAYRENWGREKATIHENIANHVENDLKELSDLTFAVHKEFMRNLKGHIGEITNPYLLDGERTNSLFQTAMNNSVKLILAAMKAKDDPEDSESPEDKAARIEGLDIGNT